MPYLATEIPVKSTIDKSTFFAQGVAWIKGMKESKLFDLGQVIPIDKNFASIITDENESLTFKTIEFQKSFSCGIRHEIYDSEDRLWRSEIVLTSTPSRAALRTRTQCIAGTALAKIQTPQKPFFVKMAIEDGWPERDGDYNISLEPIYIKDDNLDSVANSILGNARTSLPVIYISRIIDESLPLNPGELSRLALRLSGIAHVTIEPSRRFSTRLQHAANRKNPYNGTIAVSLSPYGVIKKFYLGGLYKNSEELIHAVSDYCKNIVTNRLPIFGTDWEALAEHTSDALRNELSNGSLEMAEWFKEQEETLKEKDFEIAILKEKLDKLQSSLIQKDLKSDTIYSENFQSTIGKEIYQGEFSDRLKYICEYVSGTSPEDLDVRSIKFCEEVASKIRWSGGASKLVTRVNQAGRDNTTASDRLGAILSEIGYEYRLDGGHPVYTPKNLFGLEAQTLSTSSSDKRAGKNSASRIVTSMGIKPLAK
ncbi:hypothetical protein ACP4J4_14345 [Aureimonas ureilytica]|uniref:hypothetical protein n=1 Tax=Aureimonas ureilytica TaxID=401562 RepID=UPI003CE71B54